MDLKFYVPFINTTEAVETYLNFNKHATKGKIAAVYAKSSFTGFDSFFEKNLKTLSNNGINVILDLEFSHKIDDQWISENEKDMWTLVKRWIDLGFRDILMTDIQLMKYLSIRFPQVAFVGSYKQNLSSMKQYINLTEELEHVYAVSPACAANHNLKFLRNLNAFLPMDVQLVVNNGCKPMCYRTFAHNSWLDAKIRTGTLETFYDRWTTFHYDCFTEYKKNFWANLIMSDMIYPWQLEEYAKETGIHNFRLIPPKNPLYLDENNLLNFIMLYLSATETYDTVKNLPFHLFNGYLIDKLDIDWITLDDIRTIIPDITFFTHGKGSCADKCITTCDKCYQLAQEIEQKFPVNT